MRFKKAGAVAVGQGWRYPVRPGISAIDPVIFKAKNPLAVPAYTCLRSTAALSGLQGGGGFFLVSNASGFCTGTESSGEQQSGRVPPAAVRSGQRGGSAPWSENTGLLGIPWGEAVLRDKGLLPPAAAGSISFAPTLR